MKLGFAARRLFFFAAAHSADAPRLALRAARLLDVRAGTVIENAVVVIDGNTIAEVRHDVPAGAQLVDLGDVTLLPGLFDMHTHLSLGRTERLRGPNPMSPARSTWPSRRPKTPAL